MDVHEHEAGIFGKLAQCFIAVAGGVHDQASLGQDRYRDHLIDLVVLDQEQRRAFEDGQIIVLQVHSGMPLSKGVGEDLQEFRFAALAGQDAIHAAVSLEQLGRKPGRGHQEDRCFWGQALAQDANGFGKPCVSSGGRIQDDGVGLPIFQNGAGLLEVVAFANLERHPE